MTDLHKSYVAKLGFEFVTPGSAVRCAINKLKQKQNNTKKIFF